MRFSNKIIVSWPKTNCICTSASRNSRFFTITILITIMNLIVKFRTKCVNIHRVKPYMSVGGWLSPKD